MSSLIEKLFDLQYSSRTIVEDELKPSGIEIQLRGSSGEFSATKLKAMLADASTAIRLLARQDTGAAIEHLDLFQGKLALRSAIALTNVKHSWFLGSNLFESATTIRGLQALISGPATGSNARLDISLRHFCKLAYENAVRVMAEDMLSGYGRPLPLDLTPSQIALISSTFTDTMVRKIPFPTEGLSLDAARVCKDLAALLTDRSQLLQRHDPLTGLVSYCTIKDPGSATTFELLQTCYHRDTTLVDRQTLLAGLSRQRLVELASLPYPGYPRAEEAVLRALNDLNPKITPHEALNINVKGGSNIGVLAFTSAHLKDDQDLAVAAISLNQENPGLADHRAGVRMVMGSAAISDPYKSEIAYKLLSQSDLLAGNSSGLVHDLVDAVRTRPMLAHKVAVIVATSIVQRNTTPDLSGVATAAKISPATLAASILGEASLRKELDSSAQLNLLRLMPADWAVALTADKLSFLKTTDCTEVPFLDALKQDMAERRTDYTKAMASVASATKVPADDTGLYANSR